MKASQTAFSSNTGETVMSVSLGMDRWTQSTTTNTTPTVSDTAATLNSIVDIMWYTFPLVLMALGTFGNMMVVAVMRRLRNSQSTACLSVYFTALAVSDQCLLTTVMWLWVDALFSWPPSFFWFDVLCIVPNFLWYACGQTSAWFLVAMTYQRVTSVVAPHRVGVLCTVKRGKVIVAVISLVFFAFNCHFLFTMTYWPEYGECLPREQYESFIYIYTMLDLFVGSVIPFLLLFIGNCILIAKVAASVKLSRSMRGNKNDSGKSKVYPMTRTLILTSSAFLALTLPVSIFDAYQRSVDVDVDDEYFGAVLRMGDAVTEMLWYTVCSYNFYLYLLSGSKLREEAKRCLGLLKT